jgi:hypothetical protein
MISFRKRVGCKGVNSTFRIFVIPNLTLGTEPSPSLRGVSTCLKSEEKSQ